MKNIGILGLGWLGKPLAIALENEGFEVKGSTTRLAKKTQLQQEGLVAFLLALEASGIIGEAKAFLKDVELLIVNIPPKIPQADTHSYLQKIQRLLTEIDLYEVKKVVYVSTTGVFADDEGFPEYTEHSKPNAQSPKAKQLIEAEQLFLNSPKFQSAVVRFGGLVGDGRHPVHYLAGKENLGNASAPVNLIHLEDCIQILKSIILQDTYNLIFHGVNPTSLTKAEFYKVSAEKRKLVAPSFSKNKSIGKKISSDFSQSELQITLEKSVF